MVSVRRITENDECVGAMEIASGKNFVARVASTGHIRRASEDGAQNSSIGIDGTIWGARAMANTFVA